jgi:transposase
MTKKTTRRKDSTSKQSALYLAFELSEKKWKLGFTIGLGQRVRERNVKAGELEQLQKEIKAAKERFGLAEKVPVKSCYEAGRDGFWIHRFLIKNGIDNLVVDSSSIEVNRRARRAKTDKMDVQKLANMLIRYYSGERKVWSIVRVPSEEEEDRRQLHRELKDLKKERTRAINRIRGLLANQGIRVTFSLKGSMQWMEQIRLWDGRRLPECLKARLCREWQHWHYVSEQILAVERERRRQLRESKEGEREDFHKIKRLMGLRGIGMNGSWVLVEEFFGWRQFRNRKEVGSLAGLTPTPYQSGDSDREQGISKAGNRRVRATIIELAWAWLRFQPKSKLSRWYNRRFAQGNRRIRKIGIVAAGRKLLIDLWRYLEFGVLPEGALLKNSVHEG